MSNTSNDVLRGSCVDVDEPVWRCAWCPDKPNVPGVVYTDGMCYACRLAHFVVPRLRSIRARLGATGWLTTHDRQKMARELDRIVRFLEGAPRSGAST